MKAQTPPQRRGRKTQQTPRIRQGARKADRRAQNGRKRLITRPVRRRIQAAGPNATVRKSGNVYYLFHRERRNIPWRLVFALLLVFVGGVGSAVSYANIHTLQREIRISQAALRAQEAYNLYLDADTVERYTHEEIARRARALGLGEPDPAQIIYFYQAPLSSHLFITYSPASPQENYFVQGIVAFFRSIRERIFG